MLLVLVACSPPVLPPHDAFPEGPVAGTVEIALPAGERLEVQIDEMGWHAASGSWIVDTTALTEGFHRLSVRAKRPLASPIVQQREIVVDNQGPSLQLATESQQTSQGHTLPIMVQSDEVVDELSLALTWTDGSETLVSLYSFAHRRWRGLVGIPIRTPAGALAAELTATDRLGNTAVSTVDITVDEVSWPDTGKLRRLRRASPPTEAIQEMRSVRDAAFATPLPEQRWQGPLWRPIEGRVNSPYGAYRTYPDGSKSHHDALDLDGRTGDLVYASAAGLVQVARHQAIHGNAVVLAHGHGVKTLYSHLNQLDVAEGDEVAAGDPIGTVGTTGRSTGPHLHWGVIVSSVAVNPLQWLEDDFSTFK